MHDNRSAHAREEDGGNSHVHAHVHAHTHGDGDGHAHDCGGDAGAHSHVHTHVHAHTHGEGDGHAHVHAHDCGGDAGARAPEGAAKIAAVLSYTLAHNGQHAEDLDMLAQKLRRAGFADAASALDAAGRDFRRGAEKIAEALRLLKGVQ
jgi:hypothetical protein